MENVKFELTYAALKLFGKQLYSNVGSAISELVANGVDAGATDIYISINVIDKRNAVVEILDNGCGMSVSDLKDSYIKIGYNKRESANNGHERMLGRKGIGKLAALYLSNSFTILTKKEHTSETMWNLDVSGLSGDSAPELKQQTEFDSSTLNCYDMWKHQENGTYIFLTNVDFNRFGDKGFDALACKLSNYFLYSDLGVKIHLNIFEQESERNHFKEIKKQIAFKNMVCVYTDDVEIFTRREKMQDNTYQVGFVDKKHNTRQLAQTTEILPFSSVLSAGNISGEHQGVRYELKGWIGIHCSIDKDGAMNNDERYIKNQYYSPNQLRVYVRNKLGMANMIEHLGITRAFANYIEGEIIFDILDDDALEDIATAGRQDFDPQDERFILLKNMMTKLGNALVAKRQNLADIINEEKQKVDTQISSGAKQIFKQELATELESIDSWTDSSKASLQAVVVNKIEGNENLEAKTEYTVFISHASKDSHISDFVYYYLCSLGFNGNLADSNCQIFYTASGLDSENLDPLSKVIKETIISKNNDILFLASNNFMESQYCLFEGGAAWATRAIGDYKIMALTYDGIPTFLTNGKSEFVLNIRDDSDLTLTAPRYNEIVKVLNRLISHLNKNNRLLGKAEVPCLAEVSFPDRVQMGRLGTTEQDYMDDEILAYWNSYAKKDARLPAGVV